MAPTFTEFVKIKPRLGRALGSEQKSLHSTRTMIYDQWENLWRSQPTRFGRSGT